MAALRERGPTGTSPQSGSQDDPEADEDGTGQEEEEGTLFDPLAPEVASGEVDRGEDEDPLVAHKVEFLEDGGVFVGKDSVYKFPAAGNIQGEQGSIDMVLVPEWGGLDGSTHSLLQVGQAHHWSNRMRILKNGESIRFMYFDSTGAERNVNVPIREWQPGERHQITASWDADAIRLYLDGQLAGESAVDHPIEFNDKTTIELGAPDGAPGPDATFDSVKVVSEPYDPGGF